MQVERDQETLAESVVFPGAATAEHPEKPSPGEKSQGDFHGACPVNALRVWNPGDPVVDQLLRRLGRSLVSGEKVGLPQRNHPLHPGDLPGEFHVARPVGIDEVDVLEVLTGPGEIGLVVSMPIDLCTKIDWSRPEQVHAVPRSPLGPVQDSSKIPGTYGLVVFWRDGVDEKRIRAPCEPCPKGVQSLVLRSTQQSRQIEASRSARGEVAVGLLEHLLA